jgi:hypothetical protein
MLSRLLMGMIIPLANKLADARRARGSREKFAALPNSFDGRQAQFAVLELFRLNRL